ncbi:potassium channel family protein [Catenulispora pinisilvae]|uniref:potassium channel family protein n=1 Tax=Catenulispora pinisilvae TaxID=2705253 RepID=UPI001891945B|nr:potassium channel family protein [Catenulispora pinisilvae]
MKSEGEGEREPEERGGDGGRAGAAARDDAGGTANPGGGAAGGDHGDQGGLAGDAGRAWDAGRAGQPNPRDARTGQAGDGGHRGRIPALARLAVAALGPVLLTVAYFTLPFSVIGPRHRVLAWVIPVGLLAVLAVAMTVTTDRALTDRTGRYRHPGLGILLLSWAAVLVFAASYWAMAARHNQFVGLQTRLDALYFTGVTMATVGYGDIHPSGQLARGVVLVQLVYTFAFLVGGIAALRTRTRAVIAHGIGG